MPGKEMTKLILDELKDHRTILFAIKEQTTKTNGRVTSLEGKAHDTHVLLEKTKERVETLEEVNRATDKVEAQSDKQDQRRYRWWQFTMRDAVPVIISAIALLIAYSR